MAKNRKRNWTMDLRQCRMYIKDWREEAVRSPEWLGRRFAKGGWYHENGAVAGFERKPNGLYAIAIQGQNGRVTTLVAERVLSANATFGLMDNAFTVELKVLVGNCEETWVFVNEQLRTENEKRVGEWAEANPDAPRLYHEQRAAGNKKARLLAQAERILIALRSVKMDQVEIESDDPEMPMFRISIDGRPPVLISFGDFAEAVEKGVKGYEAAQAAEAGAEGDDTEAAEDDSVTEAAAS